MIFLGILFLLYFKPFPQTPPLFLLFIFKTDQKKMKNKPKNLQWALQSSLCSVALLPSSPSKESCLPALCSSHYLPRAHSTALCPSRGAKLALVTISSSLSPPYRNFSSHLPQPLRRIWQGWINPHFPFKKKKNSSLMSITSFVPTFWGAAFFRLLSHWPSHKCQSISTFCPGSDSYCTDFPGHFQGQKQNDSQICVPRPTPQGMSFGHLYLSITFHT